MRGVRAPPSPLRPLLASSGEPCWWISRWVNHSASSGVGRCMRVASSRMATVAMVLIGLAALAVAGRLVRNTPSAEHPATSAAVTIPPAATATIVDSVEVPDAFGQTLAQAKMVMGMAGLRGTADDRDPQVPGAAVVVQEPAAGTLVRVTVWCGFGPRPTSRSTASCAGCGWKLARPPRPIWWLRPIRRPTRSRWS
jgi:hypothetical protein